MKKAFHKKYPMYIKIQKKKINELSSMLWELVYNKDQFFPN